MPYVIDEQYCGLCHETALFAGAGAETAGDGDCEHKRATVPDLPATIVSDITERVITVQSNKNSGLILGVNGARKIATMHLARLMEAGTWTIGETSRIDDRTIQVRFTR